LVPTASVSAFCRPDNVELQVVAAVLAASTAVFKVVNAAVKDGLQRTSAQGNNTYIPICIRMMAATVGQWPVVQQGRQVASRSICSVLAGSTFQVVVKCQGVSEIAAHGYYPRPGDALDAGKHIHQAVALSDKRLACL